MNATANNPGLPANSLIPRAIRFNTTANSAEEYQPYPVDNQLRLRAEFLNIIRRAIENAKTHTELRINPEWILGLIYRETSNFTFAAPVNNREPSLYTDLLVSDFYTIEPVRFQNITNDYTHFYRGRILKGTEQVCNHNILIKNNKFSMGNVVNSEVLSLANEILDLQNSSYIRLIQTVDFRGLSVHNQDIIKFIFAFVNYTRGYFLPEDEIAVRELIYLVRNNKIRNLDNLLEPVSDLFWDAQRGTVRGNKNRFIGYINYILDTKAQADTLVWEGLYAANIGRLAYDRLNRAIDQAPKGNLETLRVVNGNWLGHSGSGRFGGVASPYYLHDIGMRWYYQSHIYTPFSKDWGNLKIGGTTTRETPFAARGGRGRNLSTMDSGGCGVYTIAMIASNLLNQDITPDIALNKVKGTRHLNTALLDSGVPFLTRRLGLGITTLNFRRSGFRQRVKDELAKGNMILFVSRAESGEFPWYYGRGHFMAIRGVTEENRLMVISSTGTDVYRGIRLTPLEVMNKTIDFDTWIRYMSPNRSIVWIIGRNISN